MIAITFNSTPAFLLDDAPDWSSPVQLEATIPNSFERGLTGRETRRPTGDTLRLALSYDVVVDGDAAVTNLRNSLQALNTQPVLCPLWTVPFTPGSTPPATTAFYALFNPDGSYNSFVPSSIIHSQSSSLTAYPLLVGRLAEIPDPQALSMTLLQATIKFTENSDYAITLPAITNTNALADASGSARPLLPIGADWAMPPHTAAAEVDVTRQNIGQVRFTSDTYYTQAGRRNIQQSFTLTDGADLKLLRFFVDRAGEQQNFWLPASIIEARLTTNVLVADTALQVDNGAALGSNTAVLLETSGARVPVTITTVAGNTWNLAGAVGMTFTAGATSLESLALVRFNTLKLSLAYIAPCLASCTVKFVEVPAEIAVIVGETIGTTMGALPATAILFQFSMTTPSGTTNWYFTNFERDLSDGVNTWTHAPMEFDTITDTPDLKRNEMTITTRNFTANPLALLFPLALEFPLMVRIFEGDVTGNNVGNARCYFSGEVGEGDVAGPVIKAKCAALSHIFDRQLPRRLFQQPDNWVLFEAANGLLPANWQWNAAVVSYTAGAATLVIGTITSTNLATLAANWFAGGYLIVTSAATGAKQVRMIAASTAPAAGHITLNLSTLLTTAPAVGDAVALYPGYDGQAQTAINKFNNYANFGGFPFIPVGNPTVLRITQPSGAGKK